MDHIVPAVECIRLRGLAAVFDRANLQPLCTACHAAKSAAERFPEVRAESPAQNPGRPPGIDRTPQLLSVDRRHGPGGEEEGSPERCSACGSTERAIRRRVPFVMYDFPVGSSAPCKDGWHGARA